MQAIATLNEAAATRYGHDDAVRLRVDTKPALHILTFDPLAYRHYGILRNKAPQVKGSLALRGMLAEPSEDAVKLYAIAGTNPNWYGFLYDSYDEWAVEAVHGISEELGYPDLGLRPAN